MMMAINWDDSADVTVSYDPVALGSAMTVNDSCTYYDLYDETNTPILSSGTTFNFPAPIGAHDHVAYKVKCLPW